MTAEETEWRERAYCGALREIAAAHGLLVMTMRASTEDAERVLRENVRTIEYMTGTVVACINGEPP